MIRFDSSVTNPLLQVAIGVGEATIRHACNHDQALDLLAGLGQLPDGRDSICMRLETSRGPVSFEMLLRNYFDRAVLWRVARRAFLRAPEEPGGAVAEVAGLGPGMN